MIRVLIWLFVSFVVTAGATAQDIVTLDLLPQSQAITQAWPTHAAVALEAGRWPGDAIQLLSLEENSQAIPADFEPVAFWPDGSIKWLHVHALYRYDAGKPRGYRLVRSAATRTIATDQAARLSVELKTDGVTIDTGVGRFTLARPFVGPAMIDERAIAFASQHDPQASFEIESQGPAHVVLRCEGWYQSAEKRVAPFCRYVTRIKAYAGSNIVKFDHATIFADDMRRHGIAQLGFDLAAFEGAILERDAGKKLPARADAKQHTFWQWPPDVASRIDPADLRLDALYKFRCFHTGPLLDLRLPAPYFEALKLQTETVECKAEYARAASFQGVAMRSQWAVALGEIDAVKAKSLESLLQDNPIAMRSPAETLACGVLGKVAEFAPLSRPQGANAPVDVWAPVDQVVRDGMLGHFSQIERYRDYGWLIYGGTHEQEFMTADPPLPGRPSLHRVWSNNHYHQCSTTWSLFLCAGDPALLTAARTFTDYYAAICQVHYDQGAGYVDGNGEEQSGPSTKWHNPGAFWHCKALLPVGGRDYGMDRSDSDSGLTGHWPDPSSLLLAWLIDGDGFCLDGYRLWLANVKWLTSGAAREANTSLVHMLTAHDYLRGLAQGTNDPRRKQELTKAHEPLLAAIRSLAGSLRSMPLASQTPGPLFEPSWLSRYQEAFPTDQAFNRFVLESAATVGTKLPPTTSLSLLATAYDISGDDRYLHQASGAIRSAARSLVSDPGGAWNHYGLSPGLTDIGFLEQWPRFKAALRKGGMTQLDASTDQGTYLSGLCRFGSPDEYAARGMRVFVAKPGDGKPWELTLDAYPFAGGDLHATGLAVYGPNGSNILEVQRLAMAGGTGGEPVTKLFRESGAGVSRQQFPMATTEAGLYEVRAGSYQFAPFQRISGYPEAQLLHRTNTSKWKTNPPEPSPHDVALARGVLLPLGNARCQLKITSMSKVGAARVRLLGHDRWLKTGESMTVELPLQVTRFEVFAPIGWVRIEVQSNVDEPLLFGATEADVRAIATALRQRPRS